MGPVRIAVEPLDANCVMRSLEADEPVTVPGPHRSMMVGLNCGTPSMVAWPAMRAGVDWSVAIDDVVTLDAMRSLAEVGLVAGETGAAGVAALIALCTAASLPGTPLVDRAAMRLGGHDTVVCIVTEGATDTDAYRRLVGRDATLVHTRGPR